MQVNTIKYNKELKTQWNAFVKKCKNSTFLHFRDFMDYHSERFEDYSLLFYKKEKLIAVLPANYSKEAVYSHQGLTYGDLLVTPEISFSDYLEVFTQLLSYLHKQKIDKLYIKQVPGIFTQSLSDELTAACNFSQAKLVKSEISLATNLQASFTFSSSKRQSISRSKKNQLHAAESETCTDFWNQVLIPNLHDKFASEPVHSLEEITLLKEKFPENIRQFNVYHQDEIIGGTTLFINNNVVHAQYTSAKKEHLKLRGLDFLFNELIQSHFAEKKYFNFGTSSIENGTQINKGLFVWKQAFDAKPVLYNLYEIETKNYHLLSNLLSDKI